MKTQNLLESRLREGLAPLFLEVVNESPQHNVPENSESHFRVLIVSKKFSGLSLIQRQRMVYHLIGDQIRDKIHAFSQQTLSPEEFKSRGGRLPPSPPCAHKGKKA